MSPQWTQSKDDVVGASYRLRTAELDAKDRHIPRKRRWKAKVAKPALKVRWRMAVDSAMSGGAR